MAGDLTIAMGNGGNSSTWYLTSSKTWLAPIAIEDLPGDKPAQTNGTDAVTVVSTGAQLDADTLYFDRVLNSVDTSGVRRLDIAGYYNDVRNVQVKSSGAEKLYLDGFVHADVMVGTASSEGSDITLNGAKRGNVITGAGDDKITVLMASNETSATWVSDFRIASGAGNDVITLGGVDIAAEIAAGDKTFSRAVVSGVPIVSSGQGRVTWIDAGEGNDRVIGWDSRDNIMGGADTGRVETVGGKYEPSGFAYSVGGATRGCASVLYRIDLASGKAAAVGEVAISLGIFGKVSGLDVDSLALNAKDGMLYGFATKVGLFDALVRIDPATGKTSFVSLNLGHLRSEHQDLAFDKAGNLLFASNGDLMSVNTATGKMTIIGNNTLNCATDAIAIDPTSDRLFGLVDGGSKTMLVEIDKSNGKVLSQSVLTGVASTADLEGMSFDATGAAFAIDRVSGKVFAIDIANHSASLVSTSLGMAGQSGDGFEALAMGASVFKPLADLKAIGGDVLTGGGEADHFWYGAGDGVDTVTDFARGVDQLHIAGYDAAHIRIDTFHGDTFVRFLDNSADGFVDDAMIVLAGVTGLTVNDLILA